MREVKFGGLLFRVEYRTEAGDCGPSIRVFGKQNGTPRQVLRFDCFDNDPHYHYDPTGMNRKFHLDRLTMGCPIEFSLEQIALRARSMIVEAGFAETARTVDQQELEGRIDELRRTVEFACADLPTLDESVELPNAGWSF